VTQPQYLSDDSEIDNSINIPRAGGRGLCKGIDIYELPSYAVEKVSHGSSSDLVIQALGESTIMKLFAATLVQSLEKNLKVTSPLAYSKLLSSQPKESLVLNSMRKSNDSYDQFPCAIQYASYWPGYFIAENEMHIVFNTASGGSRWLVSCVCDPAISSSIFVLCDDWVLPPWDPGQEVVSYLAKEAMRFLAMSLSWQYFSQAELVESASFISLCLRLHSKLGRI
jgi:hypothetical protein